MDVPKDCRRYFGADCSNHFSLSIRSCVYQCRLISAILCIQIDILLFKQQPDHWVVSNRSCHISAVTPSPVFAFKSISFCSSSSLTTASRPTLSCPYQRCLTSILLGIQIHILLIKQQTNHYLISIL